MLHKFESFVPKKVSNRQEKFLNDLYKKHESAVEKEKGKLKDFTLKLKKSIDDLKNLKVEDEKEQSVIDYLKDNFSTVSYYIDVDLSDDMISSEVCFLNQDNELIAEFTFTQNDMVSADESDLYIVQHIKRELDKKINLKPSEMKKLIHETLKKYLKIDKAVVFFSKDDHFFSLRKDMNKPHVNLFHDDIDTEYKII